MRNYFRNDEKCRRFHLNHGQKDRILMVILFVFIISSVVWLIPDMGIDHDKGSISSELTVQETTEGNVARTSYVDAEGNLTCAIDKHYATIVKTLDEEGRIIEEQYLDEQGKPMGYYGYCGISYVYEGSDYTVVDQEANPRYTKAPSGNNTTPSQLIEPYEETIQVVEKTKVPVVTTVMGKGSIPTDHPLYIGNLGMHGAYAANMAVSNCDVLFSIGTRFNDRITGKLHEFAPHAQIIHIDIDTASISRNIQVDIPIVADAKEAITKMNEYVQECSTDKWLNLIKNWKEEHPLKMRPNDLLSPMDILKEINEQFENSIIVTDVGQHQMLVSQYAEITEGKQMIMSGGLGTMGYGLPGGIGAKIGNPDRPVIVISGDGGVQMNIQELATAVLEELPVILCIFNNEYLGMVRQWQKLFYGKRYAMTNLRAGALSRRTEGMEYPQYTPDFIKLAESYRAKGIRVTKKEEIAAAFKEAKKNTKAPTVIEFIIDPEEMVYPMIKPGGTLEDMIMDC